MKKEFIALAICLFAMQAKATTYIVDVNGGGDFTTIPTAINAAVTGDTIKVWPGEYRDQVDVSKDVTIIGSGYENTKIIVDADPAVILNAGEIMWFTITSNTAYGIYVYSGVLANCVMRGCAEDGVVIKDNNARIVNCICAFNNSDGLWSSGSYYSTMVYNCIFYKNHRYGVDCGYYTGGCTGYYNCFYGNGSHDLDGDHYSGGEGDLYSTNPIFSSDYDYRIPSTSPCWDAGKIDEVDLDYSRSDMGVYGGVDAPIYPVVIDVSLSLNADSTVTIKATGKAPY